MLRLSISIFCMSRHFFLDELIKNTGWTENNNKHADYCHLLHNGLTQLIFEDKQIRLSVILSYLLVWVSRIGKTKAYNSVVSV